MVNKTIRYCTLFLCYLLQYSVHNSYYERTKEFWIEQSEKYFKNEDMSVSKRTIQKFAKELCTEYCKR
jgi:hypothetical protein